MSKHEHRYGKLPHGAAKETLVHTDGRKYKRSRKATDSGKHSWVVQSRNHPDRWRILERSDFDEKQKEKDYFVVLKLEPAWEKKFESKSNSESGSASASAEEQPSKQTDVHYSKFGLDKQGREKFETVKVRKKGSKWEGKRFFYSFCLREDKKSKDKLHWARLFMKGQDGKYGFDEETTFRLVKRTLVGLSQKLLKRAIEYATKLYNERASESKRP